MTRKRIQTTDTAEAEHQADAVETGTEASDDPVAADEACQAEVANWPGTFSPYANEQFRADEMRARALGLAIEFASKAERPERVDVIDTARRFHAFLKGEEPSQAPEADA